MKKSLNGYIDISSLTKVQKDCLVAIAEAAGYEVMRNNPEHITLGLYTKDDKTLQEVAYRVQTLESLAENYTHSSRPIISIEDFLKSFAPEWATGVCTCESLKRFWWTDDSYNYKVVDGDSVRKCLDFQQWQYLQARRLFSFGESSEASTQNTSHLESYKDFCKHFGGSVSINDEYYTYYTDGDEYYEFTSLAEFEEFLRDYEGFFDKYSANMQQ